MHLISNQLQNHPKFITVHGRWAGSTPHNQRTRDHESGVGGYSALASFNESTSSPLLFALIYLHSNIR
jgi:hypothetical protein